MRKLGGTIDLRYAADVRRHLLGLCVGSLPMVFAANLINGALLCVALSSRIGWRPLAVWYALIVLMVVARYLLGRRQERSPNPDAQRWYVLFVAGCAISGCLWGAAGWLFQNRGGVVGDALLGFVLSGMGAGALASLAPCLLAFYAYFLPSILPFAIRLALADGAHYDVMALMCVLYLVSFCLLALRSHQWLVRSLNLRLENKELISSLEQRVEERTRQLKETNELLAQDIELRERAQQKLTDYGDRQAAVALFGQRALSGVSLDALFQEAAILVRSCLRISGCAILQWTGSATLRLHAAAGNVAARPADEAARSVVDAPAMRALSSDRAQVIADTAQDPRLAGCPSFQEAGVRSIADVVISGSEKPFGVIEASDARPSCFSGDEVTFMQAIANLLAAAVGRKRTETRIQRLAMEDALTGLPNRVEFRDRLLRDLASAHASRPAALMLLDLDHFKDVNDTLGHPIGDQLLIAVAARLKTCLREDEPPARLGGDEFALILSSLRHPEDAAGIARKVINNLAQPFLIEGHEVRLGASVGVALCPLDGSDADELLRKADLALYRAKEQGRNAYEFYAAHMAEAIEGRKLLERDLRQAIDGDGLEVHYQPQFSLQDGRIEAVEALLRWSHPQRGPLFPDTFIPVAEASGLIVPLGAWVFQEACRQASEWIYAGFSGLTLAVNVSLSQCRRGELADTLERIADRCGFDLRHLEVEVTEQTFFPNENINCVDTFHRLRQRGVTISIDDFGTGYSSFGRLRSLPVDKLKIDHSFVSGLGHDREAEVIVRAIIALGRSLGLRVVAEGVENEDQLHFLVAEGCDAVQGWHLAPPLLAAEVSRLLVLPKPRAISGQVRQAI
jgi:diguanylate cyclase (GGDEF)-like protein